MKVTVQALEVRKNCGDSIEYECDQCYNLKGNKKRYCKQDKKWTDAPVCER